MRFEKDLIKNFDVKKWLEDNDIDFTTRGKNLSKGWIGLNCPFCLSDPSNHLGIHLLSNSINCWRCSTKGTILKLILKIKKCSLKQAVKILKEYQLNFFKDKVDNLKEINELNNKKILPIEAKEKFYPQHIQYLKERNFDPDEIIHKYHLRACLNIGRVQFKYRIIIPIYLDNKLVCYTARDITDKRIPKYYNCPNEEALVPIKHCLYNIDSVKDRMIIVEGPTDVWRLGDGSVATFGTKFTENQITLIRKKKPQKITIIFDNEKEAIENAIRLRKYLYGICEDVKIFELSKIRKDIKDPAQLTKTEADEIKRMFL